MLGRRDESVVAVEGSGLIVDGVDDDQSGCGVFARGDRLTERLDEEQRSEPSALVGPG